MEKQRFYLFDNMKALLIFFVVLVHMYTAFIFDSTVFKAIYIFSNCFVMPLFIFVSGYFSKNTNKPIKNLFASLIIPYLVFNSIWYIIVSVLGGGFKFSILTPYGYMWYLLSLFLWRILIKYIPMNRYLIPLSFTVGLVAGLLPVGAFFSSSRTLTLLPFFLLGIFCRKEHIEKIRRIPVIVAIGFLVFPLALTAFIITGNYGFEIFYLDRSYVNTDVSNVLGIGIRLMIYISAIFTSVAIIRLLPNKETSFSYIGSRTMIIYLGHIFIRTFLEALQPNLNETLYAIILISSPVLITYILSIKFFSDTYSAIFERRSLILRST